MKTYSSNAIGFCGKIYHFFLGRKKVCKTTEGCNDLIVRFIDNPKDLEYAIKEYEYLSTLSYQELESYKGIAYSIRNVANHLGIATERDRSFTNEIGTMSTVEDHNIFNALGCTSFIFNDRTFSERIPNPPYGTTYVDYYVGTPKIKREHKKDKPGNYNDYTFSLIKNPKLSDFKLERLFDPYTTIQEIEMYIGRIAVNNTPPMPVGSDKVIAESKGFDKYSFRTPPTKKR
jgi:hypothetical protein